MPRLLGWKMLLQPSLLDANIGKQWVHRIPAWTQLLCNVSLVSSRQTLKITNMFTWKFFKLFNRTWITCFHWPVKPRS